MKTILIIAIIIATLLTSVSMYLFIRFAINLLNKLDSLEQILKKVTRPILKINSTSKDKPNVELETEQSKEEPKEGPKVEQPKNKFNPNEIIEIGKMINALKQHKGNMSAAALHLRMPYNTFHNKVVKYELKHLVKNNSNKYKRLERQSKYNELRASGKSMYDAAKEVGIQEQTSMRYELVYLKLK